MNTDRKGTNFAARPTATRTDRIMAGQNHNAGHRSALMILSCHDSVCRLRLQRNSSQTVSKFVVLLLLALLAVGAAAKAGVELTVDASKPSEAIDLTRYAL